ncbi:MAG: ABC transporter ATP-binding protein [Gemmatimonadales bacterium]|nr:MAG: ABC transporter ATP-binding protein [Gemmatimonadales bacterium]
MTTSQPDTDSSVLELRDVRRSFREAGRTRSVLDGVSFRLAGGEFAALLGPSGSGKSTLLNLISGIDVPDAGEVRVAGTDLHRLSERDRTLFRRDRIGFVFQFFNLLPTLTVEENLLLPLELAGRTTEADRGRARHLLEQVGLGDRAAAWPDRLSGGEQQRIAVARALVHQPELVLADEPTGNLDQLTGAGILELLESMVAASGTTLLMVTHSESAAGRADRILDIREGKVLERVARASGTPG